MSRTLVSLVAAAAVTSTFSVPSATGAPSHVGGRADRTAAARPGADLVRAWNRTAMDTLAAALAPVPEQPLYLAYMHRAVYDAARSANRRPDANVLAAVSNAAFTILVRHFPSQRTQLEAARAASLAQVRPGPDRRTGAEIGRSAAQQELTRRADDGRNGTPVPVPPPGPGVWSPVVPGTTALSSWLGSVRPFVLRSPSQLRPPPPPSLASAQWAEAYAETRAWGGATSTRRSPTDTETAQFWSDPPYVQNQEGLRTYSEHNVLGVLRTARLFALADTAAADGAISCWDAKMRYEFWRPVKAVPAGDTDGNPATTAEPGWAPLLPVTPSHPEYPSAHSCATTAMMTVVAGLTPGRFDLDLHSTTTGTTHHFRTLHQLVAEVADARVFGGLHWRFSTDAGAVIGRGVAHRVLASLHRHQ